MLKNLFYELADNAAAITSRGEGDAYLAKTARQYGLTNITYLGINIPVVGLEHGVYATTTYSHDWQARYASKDYLRIDPVIQRGLRRIIPLDWSEVDRSPRPVAQFFGEAQEFGVGLQGLTFPMRGLHGETALFSINSNLSNVEWLKFRREYMRDFQLIAYYFHDNVLNREGFALETRMLSERQKEVLKWAASGKTEWETGTIIGLSARTVKYHLSAAMVSLRAVNKAHAVARAVRLGLI